MPFTFPLAEQHLSALLFDCLENVTWNLQHQQETPGLGDGEGLAIGLGPSLWLGEAVTIALPDDDAYAIQARLNALDGSIHAFYLANPAKPGPRYDPLGQALGSANPSLSFIGANRKVVRLNGLPSGYRLATGDFGCLDFGSPTRRAFFQVLEDRQASSGGVLTDFEIRPHMRPGISTLPVALLRPAPKVKLVPRSVRLESTGGNKSRVRFAALQTLSAG